MKILFYVLMTIISIIFIVKMTKAIKHADSTFERIAYILLLIAYFTPIVILMLDVYNVSEKVKFLQGLNTNRWFSFVSDYAINIIGTFISGFILYGITSKQIAIQKESNKEDKRVQNMPIFDYKLNAQTTKSNYTHSVILKELGDFYHAYFSMTNIGLNHSKNLSIMIKVDEEETDPFTLEGYQFFIKKEGSVSFDLQFRFEEKKKTRNIVIEVSYYDLLNNKYVQEVTATFDLCNKGVLKINNLKVKNASFVCNN